MMTVDSIAKLLNLGIPTALIAVGVWWALAQGWPYWVKRDSENRQREHLRDMGALASQDTQSMAITALSEAISQWKKSVDQNQMPGPG